MGVAVTGALLFDMTMLSHGLEESLARVMREMGYDVRITPSGTLPFETDATFPHGHTLADALRRHHDVTDVGAMVGGTLFVLRIDEPLRTTLSFSVEKVRPALFQPWHARHMSGRAIRTASLSGETFDLAVAGRSSTSCYAIGVDRGARDVYRGVTGTDLPGLDVGRARGLHVVARAGEIPILANAELARALRVQPGGVVLLAAAPFQTLPPDNPPLRARIVGIADIRFDAPGQRTALLDTRTLQRLLGLAREDRLSLLAVRLADPSRADAVAHWAAAYDPDVTAYSMADLLRAVSRELTYFSQFALVLGSTSVVVTALLLGTIVTLSVRGRLGEIATLRALGVTAGRVRLLILAESLALALTATPLAFGLGFAIARVLDNVLREAPGLPSDMHFFVFTAGAFVRTIALLVLSGSLAALYPATVAARLPIAATLHAEVT
jgi:putative ABC transport system permease protein